MSDNKFKCTFEWEETIPNTPQKAGLFRDQIFAFKIGSSNIKISVSLDYPTFDCMVKAIEGLELLSGPVNLRLECILTLDHGKYSSIWTSGYSSLEKLKSGIKMEMETRGFPFYRNRGKKSNLQFDH